MTRWTTALLVALPGLGLAAAGSLVHPSLLDASTARVWWQLHVWLIPVFPLIAVAIAVLLRGERGPLAWAARVAAYGFATFYTALDVLAGIGGGLVTEFQGKGPVVGRLFEIGDLLGAAGVWCLFAAALLTGAALFGRDGLSVLPGTIVLATSCFPFLYGHIFHPTGVIAMIGIALGSALLALARRAPEAPARHARQEVALPAS